ncbi:MAG: SDR family NAD(P)-dependent oxidoreductase [Thermofilaceae archaeon]
MQMKVLVTGGAGFIGSHLVRRLVQSGYEVVVFDNFSTGSSENLGELMGDIEVIEGDVRDREAVEAVAQQADGVVHLAALIDVAESLQKPFLYLDVNVRGTLNVLEAARRAGVFVFASSAAVYGNPVRLPIDEEHPLQPLSPYGASKVAGEALVSAYAHIHGFRPVVLRLFNVYGPKQSKAYAGVVVEFIKRIQRGEPPVIFGDGAQTRDLVFIDDVVEYFVRALALERVRGVYNIGSGKPISVLELAEIVARVLGRPDLKPLHTAPRVGDIKHSFASIARAVRDFGYEASIPLEEGVRRTIKALRDA